MRIIEITALIIAVATPSLADTAAPTALSNGQAAVLAELSEAERNDQFAELSEAERNRLV